MTGSELKALRNGARMSVRELARKLDVNIATIYGWESGHYPVPGKREAQCLRIFGKIQNEAAQEQAPGVPADPGPKGVVLAPESLDAIRKILRNGIGKARLDEESQSAIRALVREELQEVVGTLAAEIVRVGRTLESKLDPLRLTPEVIASAREGDRYRGRCQEVLTGRSW